MIMVLKEQTFFPSLLTVDTPYIRTHHAQPIAFPVSFLKSQNPIDYLVLQVSFATFRWNETSYIENREWDRMTLQMQ